MTKNDPVHHPKHYTHGGVEVIEFTRHCSFNIGNALKYLARHEHKGSAKQDLEKALWYLEDHAANFGKRYSMPQGASDRLAEFIAGMPRAKFWFDTDLIMMDIRNGYVDIACRALKAHLKHYYS